MSRKRTSGEDSAFVPLLEEAVSLLASLPASAWAGYLLGVLPFGAGLLAFCTVMWESTLAPRQLGAGALGMAVAFVWMKYRQAGFATALLAQINPETAWENRDKPRRVFRRQLLLQPLGLFVLPLSRLVTLLHPFLFSFFQNLTVCEALGPGEAGSVPERALNYAGRNPRQLSMYVLAGHSGLYLMVLLNWLMVLAILPHLWFSFTGMENPFVRGWHAYLHVSFWMSALILTGLTLDPLNKAFYLLRGYRLAAEKTGMDLRDRTRALSAGLTRLLLLGLLLAGGLPAPVMADAQAEELRETIETVSRQRKFLWRAPPETVAPDFREQGPFTRALLDGLQWLGDTLLDAIEWFIEQWRRIFPRRERDFSDSAALLGGLQSAAEGLMILLAVILGVVLLVLVGRAVIRKRRARLSQAAPAGEAAPPDLNREEVLATELPADEWMNMVRELMGKGDTRLALRALFLAYLARLADRNLLVITRYKSNRDYETELTRRSHAAPGALPVYRDLRRAFESVWYGEYPAEPSALEAFLAQVIGLEAES
ncbi:MAG: DUF4129 domain-containing protein [Verrucomicrobia bacterium]|nr:DUF4129 domain-containing protein [Verrucomicrobiota bacterium]MCH8526480.1 DUF4129 domain-containing protein [Kiritimatiellia bacterium]